MIDDPSPLDDSLSSKIEDRYPLYPKLPEPGAQEAQELIESFKKKMRDAADEVLGQLYVDVVPFIESDSWDNFRNALLDGLVGYGNRKLQADYDFKRIREKIFHDYRSDLIEDLDQDNLKRITDLEAEVARLREIISISRESYR